MKIFEITNPQLDVSDPVAFIRSMQKSLGMSSTGTGGLTLANPKGKVTDTNLDTTPDSIDSVAPSSDSSSGSKVVVVGDSLAVGTGGQIKGAVVDAKSGSSSSSILEKIISNKELKGADVAVISAGANDGAGKDGKNPNSSKTIDNLKNIRDTLGAKKYIWILPYNRSVAKDIMSVAGSDEVIDLAKTTTPSKDGVHPSSYTPVAKSAVSKGAVVPAPAPALKKSAPASGKKEVSRKGTVNPGEVQSYLSSKGLDRNQVAGIMANIKAESSFRPGAIGDNGTSGGLFQHHKDRFTAMRQAAGPNWQTNWKGQIDFALSEPAGRKYASTKFATPEEASKWFTIHFERPADMVAKANSRSQDASQFA